KDIKKGEIFNTDNIRSVRPGYGLHPKYLNDIIGKVSKKDYKFGDRLEMF
ncbi:SAF domain-containing protein, partial [Arcobacter porcinus]